MLNVSNLIFRPGKAGGLVPKHCGETLNFHFPVSYCKQCGAEFDTPEILIAQQKATGNTVSLVEAAITGAIIGVVTGRIV